jgi:hypothetical protein
MTLASRDISPPTYNHQQHDNNNTAWTRPTRAFGSKGSETARVFNIQGSKPTRAFNIQGKNEISKPGRTFQLKSSRTVEVTALGKISDPVRISKNIPKPTVKTDRLMHTLKNFKLGPNLDFKTVVKQLKQAPTVADYEDVQANALAHVLPIRVTAVLPTKVSDLFVEQAKEQTSKKSIWFDFGYNLFKQATTGLIMGYGNVLISGTLETVVPTSLAKTVSHILVPLLAATVSFVLEKNKNLNLNEQQQGELKAGIQAAYVSSAISGGLDSLTGGTASVFAAALNLSVKSQLASVVTGFLPEHRNLPIDATGLQATPKQLDVPEYNDSRAALALALVASVTATFLIGSPMSSSSQNVFEALGGPKVALQNAFSLGKTAANRIWTRSGLSANPINQRLKDAKTSLENTLALKFLNRGVKSKLFYDFAKNVTEDTLANLVSGYVTNGILQQQWNISEDIHKDFTSSKARLLGMLTSLQETGSITLESILNYSKDTVASAISEEIVLEAPKESEMLAEQRRLENRHDQLESEYKHKFEVLRRAAFVKAEASGEALDIVALQEQQKQAVLATAALQNRRLESSAVGNLLYSGLETSKLEMDVELYHQQGLAAGQEALLNWSLAARDLADRLNIDVDKLSEKSVAEHAADNPSRFIFDSLSKVTVPKLLEDTHEHTLPQEVVNALEVGPKVEGALEHDTGAVQVVRLLTDAGISDERLSSELTSAELSGLLHASQGKPLNQFIASLTAQNLSSAETKTLEDVKQQQTFSKSTYVQKEVLDDVLEKMDSLQQASNRERAYLNAKTRVENVESDIRGIAFGRLLEGLWYNREEASREQVAYELLWGRDSGRQTYKK